MVLTPDVKALQIDSLPCQIELATVRRAIPEIQVNETLVWNSDLLGYAFEIANGVFIQTDRDLLF